VPTIDDVVCVFSHFGKISETMFRIHLFAVFFKGKCGS
jgi:hypothetical protein